MSATSTGQAIADAAREVSFALPAELVPKIKSAAAGRGRQAALAADSVRVGDDGEIKAAGGVTLSPGGRRRHPPRGAEVFYGSEFGSARHRQFPSRSTDGYWFVPTIVAALPTIDERYLAALEAGRDEWERSGKTVTGRG